MSETFDANNLPSTETNIPPFVCIPIPCFNSLASAPYALKVDIKREIAISMVDQNAVKSEVTLGKVKTKKDKLRQLRKRR